ncbi:cell division protein DedD [Streptomyces sp. NPDC056210]|uniref:cell division protein DedD n=1 Tax=Streptomyces sp. NPDC056210 TaxID=3345746 RepID=UPI0035DDF429
MSRPDDDAWALGIAKEVATKGECRRSKVGAVLIDFRGRLRGAGYNGVAPKEASCLQGACPRGLLSYEEQPAGGSYANCKAVHAEENLLFNSESADQVGGTVYVTRSPCEGCERRLRIAGVSRVVWLDEGGKKELSL